MESDKGDRARRMPDDAKLNSLVSAMADAQARARAEALEKAGKARRRSKLHPVVPFLLLVPLNGILLYNLTRPLNPPPVPAEISLKETVYFTALALNAEYEESGAYPPNLETIGMDEEGLQYSETVDGYVLTASEDSVRVHYRSGEDLEPFRVAFESLVTTPEEVR